MGCDILRSRTIFIYLYQSKFSRFSSLILVKKQHANAEASIWRVYYQIKVTKPCLLMTERHDSFYADT